MPLKKPSKIFARGTSSSIGPAVSLPVGVPIEVAKKYPKANAGVGCVTNDIPLRERQEEYARRYNAKIFAYINQKH
jgi:hypothetical protein